MIKFWIFLNLLKLQTGKKMFAFDKNICLNWTITIKGLLCLNRPKTQIIEIKRVLSSLAGSLDYKLRGDLDFELSGD